VALGGRLAHACLQATTVFLHGSLGAGKTTLTRGWVQGLGHQGKVKSPTYTLVEPYELVRDYFAANTLCLVEWPEKGEGWLPAPDLDITLTYVNEQREALIEARTAIGEAILERLSSTCA